jgi:L-seryl-tRNA(Ser) seleniumtransferase
MSDFNQIPSVEQLLQTRTAAELIGEFGRPLVLQAIRGELVNLRRNIRHGGVPPDQGRIFEEVTRKLEIWLASTLTPVINATGVILHTNLGRAPLSKAAVQAIQGVATGYCTLEYGLAEGVRGDRSIHAMHLLMQLTQAPAAMVVNNNASAVLRVIISRTQLVEIGGGFRIPDVMKQSGAKLVEIGTTNRVHLSDYESALQEEAAVVLRAHHSNFKIIGFTEEPELAEIARLTHTRDAILVDDLGSGALIDTAHFGLAHEPTVQESLNAGADLVCFSGDKLLGGPQAGIIVGAADLVAKLKKHPLARAVRADKLCLAALAATLQHYLKDEAERTIPIWKMIATTPEQTRARAEHWVKKLHKGEVLPSRSTVGGGSLPEETLPTFVLALSVPAPEQFQKNLRDLHPPIIARIENDRVLLDPRTVLPEQEEAILVGLMNIFNK